MIEDIKDDQEQNGSTEQQPEIPAQEEELAGEDKISETAVPEGEVQIEPSVDATETLSQEIENLKQQVADNLDKAMRAQAEMENLRKRTAREIENAHKYGLERFLRDILPVVDSMELGISAAQNAGDINGFKEGMDLTHKMFIDVLNKFGIEVIDPRGTKFNPELHEAVSMYAVEGQEPGTVIEVMQKGYLLNDRLVRPAMVVVAQ